MGEVQIHVICSWIYSTFEKAFLSLFNSNFLKSHFISVNVNQYNQHKSLKTQNMRIKRNDDITNYPESTRASSSCPTR